MALRGIKEEMANDICAGVCVCVCVCLCAPLQKWNKIVPCASGKVDKVAGEVTMPL